ncbi:alkaline phosphatase D family protein [Rhodopirellula sp. SWK7]|uniref:alkaline phosphatase D family protein n=1 Tax=Rhodopirellula sp. SWK7 TaxID=595460 RepID=UPI0002BFA66B|nr:alkaline phosphatase D family protein [Rhodopirellula sp. SWK7]EMI43125.1 Twin-arginine translocation pathway signal [Rhodopirellula sp. SWK7]
MFVNRWTLDFYWLVLVATMLAISAVPTHAASTEIDWQGVEDRRWPGREIWANRLQDWSVVDGQLQCAYEYGGRDWRTAHVLTHDVDARGDRVEVELVFRAAANGHMGVLLGGGEGKLNYKQASMIQGIPGLGGGFVIDVAWAANKICIRDFGSDAEVKIPVPIAETSLPATVQLGSTLTMVIEGQRLDVETFTLTATLRTEGKVIAQTQTQVPAERLVGNVAIVSMDGTQQSPHQFTRLRLSGDRIASHPERAYGPIAGVLYSVAGGDLKVGVQCMSVGKTIQAATESRKGTRTGVQLEQQQPDGSWKKVSRPVGISEPDYYALLRIKDYDNSAPANFRVVMLHGPKDAEPYPFFVPAEPVDRELVVGGVSCTGDIGRKSLANKSLLQPGESYIGVWSPANQWAPFGGITEPLIEKRPDIVFFTGDQLYEWWPTPIDMTDAMPVEDYLYKWLIWHWSFQNVTSRVPCLLQTDDHDVWHPNLWGDGSRLMTEGWDHGGGYIKSGYFVNMVQRTMCGHNPDAYSPGPSDSGITNYFCTFSYGGVDFALLEDRKFKSSLPSVDAGMEPTMLGDTQLKMLSEWADAPNPSKARVIVSQTNYVTLNTIGNGKLFADRDSNGWPKTARDRAVELFGRAGAFLFTGDQHLASVTRMNTPTSRDGVYQFCQPAGGCIWWRWFYPNEKEHIGGGPREGKPSYIGEFNDAFGNHFETYAVANPGPEEDMPGYKNTSPSRFVLTPQQREAGVGTRYRIHQGEGFGIVRIDIANDRMILECWPDRNATMLTPYRQFDGWPVELKLGGRGGDRLLVASC